MNYSPIEHRRVVREIFSTIHGRYDLLNHLLSCGLDVLWRQSAIRHLTLPPSGRLLDLACGTADVAILAARTYPGIEVTGVDASREMLSLARNKIARHHLSSQLRLIQADALALPFEDGRFDAVTIAFGIRNITPVEGALREMIRVCKGGGKMFILEMHYPSHPGMKCLFKCYTRTVFPLTATLLSRNPRAYDYLVRSITAFPSPREFSYVLAELGLTDIRRHALPPGITYLHVGTKPGVRA